MSTTAHAPATHCALFLGSLRVRGHAPATLRVGRASLNVFSGFLSSRPIDDIRQVDRETIRAYALWLVERNHAPLTRQLRLKVLRRFFAHLETNAAISHNPCAGLELPKLEDRLPRTILTVTEAQRLLDGPDTRTAMGIRDRAILEVFYSCGIRVGEMAGLSVGDVDWRHGFLRITRGKSANDRVVPFGATAAACVRDYLCRVRPMWSRDGHAGPALWLSSREPHRPITAQTVQVMVRRYARTAGVGRPVTPHVWRHTCATHFLNAGANLIAVQHLLGHRSLTTTQIYTRVSVSEMQQTHRRAHPRAKVRP